MLPNFTEPPPPLYHQTGFLCSVQIDYCEMLVARGKEKTKSKVLFQVRNNICAILYTDTKGLDMPLHPNRDDRWLNRWFILNPKMSLCTS